MPKRQKGFATVALIIIVIAIAAIGSYLFLKKPEVKPEVSQIPEDWLTYENEKYFYRISYPPNFHAQENNEPPYPPPPTGKAFTFKYDNGEWCDFMINVAPGVNGFEGEIESIRKEGKETETVTTLVGLPTSIFDAQGGEAINRSLYLTKGTTQFRLGYNYKIAAKYSQDCANIVTKMISSFNFTK